MDHKFIMVKFVACFLLMGSVMMLSSCSKDEPASPVEIEGSEKSGGMEKNDGLEEYPDFYPFFRYNGVVQMSEGTLENKKLKYIVPYPSSCPNITGYDLAIPTGILSSVVEISEVYPLTKVTYTVNGKAFEQDLTDKTDVTLTYANASGQEVEFMKLHGIQDKNLTVEVAGSDVMYGIVGNIRICFDGLPSYVALDGEHYYGNQFTEEYMVPELNDVAYRIYPGKFTINWRPIFVHGMRVYGDNGEPMY